MKKLYIGLSVAVVLSGVSFAFAEEGTSNTGTMQPMPIKAQMMREDIKKEMPKMMGSTTRPTTGSSTVDAQVKALNKELEAKIKALRDEYALKIKAILGDTRPTLVRPDGSTTTPKEMYKEVRGEMKDMMEEAREYGSSTKPLQPEVNRFFNFFRGMFNR